MDETQQSNEADLIGFQEAHDNNISNDDCGNASTSVHEQTNPHPGPYQIPHCS